MATKIIWWYSDKPWRIVEEFSNGWTWVLIDNSEKEVPAVVKVEPVKVEAPKMWSYDPNNKDHLSMFVDYLKKNKLASDGDIWTAYFDHFWSRPDDLPLSQDFKDHYEKGKAYESNPIKNRKLRFSRPEIKKARVVL